MPVHTQGTDPDYVWAVTVMLYWLKLAAGIVAGALSALWLVHVVLFVFLSPPLHPFLNAFFKAMDSVFPLFGTLAFAVFCSHLIGAWHSAAHSMVARPPGVPLDM